MGGRLLAGDEGGGARQLQLAGEREDPLSAGEAALIARLRFVALAIATIALGLGVHWYGGALGPAARDILGDALWATMIAWWIGALAPGAPIRTRGIAALAICCAVELSQLVHVPALDSVRATTLGRLVLGSGFDPRDLAAYTLGVLAAVGLELAARRRRASG